MPNEILLILSLILLYASILLCFRFFGNSGLFAFTAAATILSNIEVLILVRAFGMEQTLGNLLFASNFVVTDILSETYGKKEAAKAVRIGIAVTVFFLLISGSWLLYTPAGQDTAMASVRTLFSRSPRILLSGLAVYAIVQWADVLLYHKIWNITTRKFGDARRFLWLRNNAATIFSQGLNSLLYTFFAFYGVYPLSTLWSIVGSSSLIFCIAALADTPVLYLARRIHEKHTPSP